MFDPFYCLFSNAERAFRTYKTFGPGDDRLLMPDGVRLIWIGIIPNTCSGLCSSQWASKILREQHIGQRRSWPSGQVGKCICSNGIAHFVEFLRMPCSIWSKQLLPTCATLKLARWNWWHCLGCSSGMIVRLPLLFFFFPNHSSPFTAEEISNESLQLALRVRNEIIVDLHLFYRSQGLSEAEITLKTCAQKI